MRGHRDCVLCANDSRIECLSDGRVRLGYDMNRETFDKCFDTTEGYRLAAYVGDRTANLSNALPFKSLSAFKSKFC